MTKSRNNSNSDENLNPDKEPADAEAAVEDEAKASEAEPETDGQKSEQKSDGGEKGEIRKNDESPAAPEEQESNDLRYMRLAADFQNFKRRAQKEKSDIYNYANEKIALDIIEVIDNFERALTHSEGCEDKKFIEGVEMIYKQLLDVLSKNNVVEIESDGAKFDPNFHSAVMAEDNPDYESGIVIQTMQKGYTLNGKVIRPSMVKVSQ